MLEAQLIEETRNDSASGERKVFFSTTKIFFYFID
jgi:hypothetical protein